MNCPDRVCDLGQFVSCLIYRCFGITDYKFGDGLHQDFLYGLVPDFHRIVNYLGTFLS